MHQDSQGKLVISCWPIPPDHAGSASAFFGNSLWLSLCREPGARAPDCIRHQHTSLSLPWEQQAPQLPELHLPCARDTRAHHACLGDQVENQSGFP